MIQFLNKSQIFYPHLFKFHYIDHNLKAVKIHLYFVRLNLRISNDLTEQYLFGLNLLIKMWLFLTKLYWWILMDLLYSLGIFLKKMLLTFFFTMSFITNIER